MLPVPLPFGLCKDGAGVVEQVGESVPEELKARFKPGTEVVFDTSYKTPTLAEYVVTSHTRLALKPANLSMEEAGSLGLAVLTSFQALHKHGGLPVPSEQDIRAKKLQYASKDGADTPKVLVLGGAGGVGSFAVQWASKVLGAHVTTTASARNVEFVTRMGADRVINYREKDWSEELKGEGFTVVFNCAGDKDPYVRASGVLKEDGVFVSITHNAKDDAQVAQQQRKWFLTDSSGADLATCMPAFEVGSCVATLDKTYAFTQSADAVAYSASGKATGKIVVKLVGDVKTEEKENAPLPQAGKIQLPPGYRKTALEMSAGADLKGKLFIVTGGSSGIGVETVRALVARGAKVINASRNVGKVGQVNAQLVQSTDGVTADQLEAAALDLGSLQSVYSFADSVLQRELAVQGLVLNAGIMAPPERVLSQDGFEIQFAVNFLGNFVLMTRLVPCLQRAGNARVVVVSSCAHLRNDVQWDDLLLERSYNKTVAYAHSKSAAIRLSNEFDRQFSSLGIRCNALHPGGIFTGLQVHMSKEEQIKLGWIDKDGNTNPLFKTVEQGAATSVYAAVHADMEGKGGLYLEDCAPGLPTPRWPIGYAAWTQDAAGDRRLWESTERLLMAPYTLDLDVRPDKVEEFLQVFGEMQVATRGEDGVFFYDLWRLKSDPTKFNVVQKYRSAAAGKAHMTYPHTLKMLGRMGEFLAAPFKQTDYALACTVAPQNQRDDAKSEALACFTLQLDVRPDQLDAFQEAMEECVLASRKEDGVVLYDLWRLKSDPTKFNVVQKYTDADAGKAHMTFPHTKKLLARMGEFLAAPFKQTDYSFQS